MQNVALIPLKNDAYDQLKTLSPKITRYLCIEGPGTEEAIRFLNSLDETKKKLEKLFDGYTYQMNVCTTKKITRPNVQYNNLWHPLNCTFSALLSMATELDKITYEYFQSAAQTVSTILDFIDQNANQSFPISCTTEKISKVIADEYSNVASHLIKGVNILDKYINETEWPDPSEVVPKEKVLKALQVASSEYDKSTEFVPISHFDEIFFAFLQSTRYVKVMDDSSNQIFSNYQKTGILDFSPLTKIQTTLLLMIGPYTLEQNATLRIAIGRVQFDRLYQLHSSLFDYSDEKKFISQCKVIRELTPAILKFSKPYISEKMLNTKVKDIVKTSLILTKALEDLNMICFYSNPLDMSKCIFIAMKKIEDFVNGTCGKPKTGMAFDDIFVMFYAFLACNPPTNSIAISRFLSSIRNYNLSSSFDFSKLLFTSAIDYIIAFNPKSID